MNEKTNKTKLFAIIFVMVVAFVGVSVIFDESDASETSIVNIDTVEELADAIANQQENQEWHISEGEYVLTQESLDEYSSWTSPISPQGGWYFPLHENNISIIGYGDVLITSNVESPNGNWATQDFVSVWADGITIDNVDFKSKSSANKVIEVMGKDFTLRNSTLMKVDDWGSGSIIFNATNADGNIGDALIENVTLYNFISVNYSKIGNLDIKNVTVDFTDNGYAGYSDDKYGYGWNPGVFNNRSSVSVDCSDLTLVVDQDIVLSEQILKADYLKPGTIVELSTDVKLDANATIGADVTFAGSGKLVIPAGQSLTVDDGITMTNDTTVENNGTVHNNGTIVNNGSITGTEIGGTVIDNTGDEPFQVDSADGIGQAFDSGATNVEYTGAVESATRIPEVPSGGTLTITASGGSVANPNGGQGFTVAAGGVIGFSGITTTSTFTVNGPDGSKVEFVGITGTGIKVTGGSANIEGSFGTDSSGSITVTGESRLTGDVVLGDGVSLTVIEGTSLEIPSGMTLTVGWNSMLVNNGTINNYGTISNGGAFLNDGHVGGTGIVDSTSGYISGSGTIDNEVIQPDWSGDDDYPVTTPEQPESDDDSEIAVIVAAAAAVAVLMCVFVLMGRGKI